MGLFCIAVDGSPIKCPATKFLFLTLIVHISLCGAAYAQTPITPASNHLGETTSSGFTGNITGGFEIDIGNRDAVEQFYNTVFQSTVNVPSGWNGSVDRCQAGDTSTEYKSAILRRINWYRAMAGVPADIRFDDTANFKAQQAALLMAANSRLSHNPDRTWRCFSAVGSDAARTSNLALGSAGASSISQYMADFGAHNFAVGHRRWMLFPQTQTMGTGDVDENRTTKANTLWVIGPRTAARPPVRDEFVAWPPPGFVPFDTVTPRWSFSYPWADFSSATVRMTENGKTISARKEEVKTGYGENTMVWIPGSYTHSSRWQKPLTDMTYEVKLENVRIAGVPQTFNYTVTVFAPEPADTDTGAPGTIPGDSAPVVAIMGGSRTVADTDNRLDESVRLGASAHVNNGSIVQTQWLIGNRVVATGLSANIRFNPGTTVVTFRATDNTGNSSDIRALIRVETPQLKSGWESAYNGITPSSSLQLPLNNIGLIDTEARRVYTCVAIVENQQPSTLNGVERFDIVFDIVSLEAAIIRVQKSRAFNMNLQTTYTGEQPSCSGTYDTATRMYRDTLVMDNETLVVEFYMYDEAALQLQLQQATGLTSH